MEYFFIPGRLQALSFFELDVVCKRILGYEHKLSDENGYFLLSTNVDSSSVAEVFSKLGGFIKYGVVLDTKLNVTELSSSNKVVFGISSYTSRFSLREIKKLSQNFKEELSKSGKKVRFVLPSEGNALSSSQILNYDLLEIVILGDKMGKTIAIQDIEAFASRDYDKPFVDKNMGVLPLKLARMMVNYANIEEGKKLWDPFCGSGNTLLEGLDLGYDVLGSDIDEKSLEGAKVNMDWAVKKFGYKAKGNVFYLDILNVSKSKLEILRNANIGGIVCEPYMGSAQKKLLDSSNAQKLVNQHYSLVKGLFNTLSLIGFSKKIRIVVVFPEYKTKNGWISIGKDSLNFKNTKLICKDLHWSRGNSIIKRLIFVFEYCIS